MAARFKPWLSLCRLPIALFTAYSALAGHLLAPHRSPASGLLTGVAVFILACGASALNQYQERKIDARMERTKNRPLPSRTLGPLQALSFSLGLIGGGLALLLSAGAAPFILGVLAVAWYNGVYTGLKRCTAFAAVPGGLSGMTGPAIGWTCSGGSIADPRLFAICFLFFIWQVPHFWLQLLHHGDEYEQAGLPSLTRLLTRRGIARMTFAWICAAAFSGLLLPLYGVITSPALYCLLLPGSVWVALKSFRLVNDAPAPRFAFAAFRTLNGYLFYIMSLLFIQGFFPV